MSSLAGITERSRSILKFGAIAAVALFILYILFLIGGFFKSALFPEAPIAPEQAFGTLPEIVFTQNPSPNTTFQINTINGRLPTDFPDRLPVFTIDQPKAELLSLQNARGTVAVADFKTQETKIDNSLYQWTNTATGAFIQYNIITHNFDIRSNYLASQHLLTQTGFPDTSQIRTDTFQFLNSLAVDTERLGFRDTSIQYYSVNGSTMQEVINPLDGDVVRVSLYNKNITLGDREYQIMYPNFPGSTMSIVLSYPSQRRPVVLEGEFYGHQIQRESSDYPIKTAEEAYTELTTGNGFMSNPALTNLEITDVYLAYYLDKNTTEYLQPIVVFEGINGIAYIPAVKSTPVSTPAVTEE